MLLPSVREPQPESPVHALHVPRSASTVRDFDCDRERPPLRTDQLQQWPILGSTELRRCDVRDLRSGRFLRSEPRTFPTQSLHPVRKAGAVDSGNTAVRGCSYRRMGWPKTEGFDLRHLCELPAEDHNICAGTSGRGDFVGDESTGTVPTTNNTTTTITLHYQSSSAQYGSTVLQCLKLTCKQMFIVCAIRKLLAGHLEIVRQNKSHWLF